MLHLRHALLSLRRERYMRYSQREWLTSLVTQICMAIGNRDRYKAANEDMLRLLEYLRDLDLPDNENAHRSENAYDDITAFWRRVFGDPDEWERKQVEKRAGTECTENDEARSKRERDEFIRKNLFK